MCIFFYYFVVFIKNCFYKYYRFFVQRLILFEFFLYEFSVSSRKINKNSFISPYLQSHRYLYIYINCGTNTPIFCLIRAFFPSVQITQSSLDGLPSLLLLLLFIYLFKLFLFVKYLIAFGGKSSKKIFVFGVFVVIFIFNELERSKNSNLESND